MKNPIRYVGIRARGPGFEYGVDAVTPAGWQFSATDRKAWTHSYRLPDNVICCQAFQDWAQLNKDCSLSLIGIKNTVRAFAVECAS